MSLIMPGVEWDPLGNPASEPAIKAHDVLCYHTMVGNLVGTNTYFHDNGYGGTESHLGVGGKWGNDASKGWDGYIKQWQDCMYEADANYKSNYRVVSVETADNTPANDGQCQPWTDKQIDANIKIGVWFCDVKTHKNCPSSWACHTFGVPPVLIPDSKAGRRGIGYHRQGIQGNFPPPYTGWVSGGELWSSTTGKPCPCTVRITQLINDVIPEIAKGLSQPIPTPDDEDEMQPFFVTRSGKQSLLVVPGYRAVGLRTTDEWNSARKAYPDSPLLTAMSDAQYNDYKNVYSTP